MPNLLGVAEEIVEDLIAAEGLSHAELTKDDPFPFPRLISAGNGLGSIQITKRIDDNISVLARLLKSERPGLSRSVKESEWRTWVRSYVGSILYKLPSTSPASDSASIIISDLNAYLDGIVTSLTDREHAFASTLFTGEDVAAFSIGPVIFEPRDVWLFRKLGDGSISTPTHRRIERRWAGKKLAARRNPAEQIKEDEIVHSIGSCPYVCSVRLPAVFAPDAGLEVALTAVRLALTCIALTYEKSSDALKDFNLQYDGPVYRQIALVFTPGRTLIPGSKLSRSPRGLRMSNKTWTAELSSRAPFFAASAEVLNNLVDPARQNLRAPLLEALLHSLMWFEKGCRETGDLMSVVAFAASLDALGKGSKVRGILKVLEARLGIKPKDPINAQGPTFESVIDNIYSQGRSRMIHGTSDKIGFDWRENRLLSEQIGRIALYSCLDYAGRNSSIVSSDDLKK